MDVLRRAARVRVAARLERRLVALGVARHGTLLVAVSGGADSTALLLLAAAVARRRGWRIEAATVDHHLRADSAADAAHAETVAESIGVPIARLDVHPGRGPGAPARARRERYRALAGHARSRGIAAVVTAHHARDQLETMLLAMARGAGVRAAGGMSARRRLAPGVELLRPLLEEPAAALVGACRTLGVPWREDPTNADESSPRVALRTRVIPELERLRPGAARRAAALAELIRAAGRRFERAARTAAPERSFDRARLARRSRARRLEFLRQWLVAAGARPSARRLGEIDAAIVDDAQHERRWDFGASRGRSAASLELRVIAQRVALTHIPSAAGSGSDRATRRT